MDRIEVELETDGRWIAEAIDYPGVMVYGRTPEEARQLAAALLKRVLEDRALFESMSSGAGAAPLDAGNLMNLLSAIEDLARDADAQLAWMSKNGFDADELALQFDDVYTVAEQLAERGRLPRPALLVLNEINATFDQMSDHPELYSEEGLTNALEWDRIRALAKTALKHIRMS